MSRQLRTADVFFILSAMPVALLFVLAPQTFMWFWPGMGNLGRGGFLFVLFFLGFELVDFRKAPSVRLSRNRELAIGAIVAIGLCYFEAIALFKPLADFIYQVGPPGGSGGYSVSWLMATDYMALTAYLVSNANLFAAPNNVYCPLLLQFFRDPNGSPIAPSKLRAQSNPSHATRHVSPTTAPPQTTRQESNSGHP